MGTERINFVGADRSGKSTLLEEFRKQNNFKYYAFDRGEVCNLVFDDLIRNKPKDRNKCLTLFLRVNKVHTAYIHVSIPYYIYKARCIKTKEQVLYNEIQYNQIKNKYEQYLGYAKFAGMKVIYLDGTKPTQDNIKIINSILKD